jgi:hypothetical protein
VVHAVSGGKSGFTRAMSLRGNAISARCAISATTIEPQQLQTRAVG